MSWVSHRKWDLQMSFEGSQSFTLSSEAADLDGFLVREASESQEPKQ